MNFRLQYSLGVKKHDPQGSIELKKSYST